MQDKIKSVIIYILFILFVILVLYFILNPLFNKSILQIAQPRKILSMEYARDYYSVISSIFTIIGGILGLALGYFYYINKKENDDTIRNREQTRKKLEDFMRHLDVYDEQARVIFKQLFKDDNELALIKVKIERSWEYMECMLDPHYALLGFKKDDINVFIKLNSFVDKNISAISTVTFSSSIQPDIFNDYTQLIHPAQQKCHERLV
jgi:hypothetical protein